MADDLDYIPFEGDGLWSGRGLKPPPISEATLKQLHMMRQDMADRNRCSPPINILLHPDLYQ